MSGFLAAPMLAGVSLSISPTSQLGNSGAAGLFTFSAETVTVNGGTPSSYIWSFPTTNGVGTWGVNSGQGTASGVARVTGLASSDNATATFQCAVVVGGVTYNISADLEYSRL